MTAEFDVVNSGIHQPGLIKGVFQPIWWQSPNGYHALHGQWMSMVSKAMDPFNPCLGALGLFLKMGYTTGQGLLNVPFWVYWTSPYSSHYRPYT